MFGKNAKEYKEWLAHRAYLDIMPYGLRAVNTGSTGGYHAFDYRDWKVPGYNLGWQPQTLYYDFETLKRFSSHLVDGATVFITIEHFKFLVDHYPYQGATYKYYFFLEPEQIKGYKSSISVRLKCCPCLASRGLLRSEVDAAIQKVFHHEEHLPEFGSREEKDAYWGNRFLRGWYKEFGWEPGTDVLFEEQKRCITIILDRLKEMLGYCIKQGWKPVVVIIPLSPSISDNLPPHIMEECLWDPIEEIKSIGYNVVDLFHHKTFHDPALYENALTLNDNGRQIFNEAMQALVE